MRSRLPKQTEEQIRKLCQEYPKHKELIDDALEEALDPGVRKTMRQDLAHGRGFDKTPMSFYMSEAFYKEEKYRAKLCIAHRFGLAV